MTLFIGDSEINRVLPMADCIAAMERAFAEEARGEAANQPRARYKVPPDPNAPKPKPKPPLTLADLPPQCAEVLNAP